MQVSSMLGIYAKMPGGHFDKHTAQVCLNMLGQDSKATPVSLFPHILSQPDRQFVLSILIFQLDSVWLRSRLLGTTSG